MPRQGRQVARRTHGGRMQPYRRNAWQILRSSTRAVVPYAPVAYAGATNAFRAVKSGWRAFNAWDQSRTRKRRPAPSKGYGPTAGKTGARKKLKNIGATYKNSRRHAQKCLSYGAYPFPKVKWAKIVAYMEPTPIFTNTAPAPDNALCAKLPLRRIQNAQLALNANANNESSAVFRSTAVGWAQFNTPRYLDLLTTLYEQMVVNKVEYEITVRNYNTTHDAVLFWKVIYPHEDDGAVYKVMPYNQAGFDNLQRSAGVKCLELKAHGAPGSEAESRAKLRFTLNKGLYRDADMLVDYHDTLTSGAQDKVQQNSASVIANDQKNYEPFVYIWLYRKVAATGLIATTVWDATTGNTITFEGKQISSCMFFHPPEPFAQIDDAQGS